MNSKKIGLNKFSSEIGRLLEQFPNARLSSIGTGTNGKGDWYYVIILDNEGKKIQWIIPCYE